MRIKLYQVDAFTNHLFGGNPAAVFGNEEEILALKPDFSKVAALAHV
jgi:predicted PhzF superfamily epimerase YddE/YHI9